MRLTRRAVAIAVLVIAVLVAAVLDANKPRILTPQGSVEFGGHDPQPLVLSVASDGRVYVLQELDGAFRVQAFRRDGQRQWVRPVKGCSIRGWGAVVLSAEGAEPGSVTLPAFEAHSDVLVVRAAQDGKVSHMSVPGSTTELSGPVRIVPAGDSIYTTGETDRDYRNFPTAIRADYSGVRLWKTVETRVDGSPWGGVVDREGNVILIGDIGAGCGPYVVKFSATGKRMWARETEVTDGTSAIWVGSDDKGRIATIFTMHEGVVASSGDDVSGRGQDYVLSIYSPAGQLVKTTVLAHGAGLEIRDAAINGKGEIIVVGSHRRTTLMGYPKQYKDAQVIKCDANGDVVWSRRVRIPAGCLVRQVEVDKRGDIYVSGYADDIAFWQSLSSNPRSQREIYVARHGRDRSDVKWFVYRFRDPK